MVWHDPNHINPPYILNPDLPASRLLVRGALRAYPTHQFTRASRANHSPRVANIQTYRWLL